MFTDAFIELGRDFDKPNSPESELRIFANIKAHRKFFRNVIVIEVDATTDGMPTVKACPTQIWCGTTDQKSKLVLQEDKALGCPFLVPFGGNATNSIGYTLPVYPLWMSSLVEKKKGFLDKWKKSIDSRLQDTDTLNLVAKQHPDFLNVVEREVIAILKQIADSWPKSTRTSEAYGLLVIALVDGTGLYRYADMNERIDDRDALIGNSQIHPEKKIMANLASVARAFFSRNLETAEADDTEEQCSICRKNTKCVSMYTPSWSFLKPTWEAPFPASTSFPKNNDSLLISNTIGRLCLDCYRQMLLGMGVFEAISGPIGRSTFDELVTPNESLVNKRQTSSNELHPYGAVFPLPMMPSSGANEDIADAYDDLLHQSQKEAVNLRGLTGLSEYLPITFLSQYRLGMIYYTKTNADTGLLAAIEDVAPSTASFLMETLHQSLKTITELFQTLGHWKDAAKYEAWFDELPCILAHAYGSEHVWSVMNMMLHGEQLQLESFSSRSSRKMSRLARNAFFGSSSTSTNARQMLYREVYFYFMFEDLFRTYSQHFAYGGNTMRDWKELVQITEHQNDAKSMDVLTDPQEVGFVAGIVLGKFGYQYYRHLVVTKQPSAEPDMFMKTKVLQFRAKLTPDDIWKSGLGRLEEYNVKYNLGTSYGLLRQGAEVERRYAELRQPINKETDEFMAAFWSGYVLRAE